MSKNMRSQIRLFILALFLLAAVSIVIWQQLSMGRMLDKAHSALKAGHPALASEYLKNRILEIPKTEPNCDLMANAFHQSGDKKKLNLAIQACFHAGINTKLLTLSMLNLLKGAKNYNGMKMVLLKGLQKYPNDLDLLLPLATSLLELKDFKSAAQVYVQLVNIVDVNHQMQQEFLQKLTGLKASDHLMQAIESLRRRSPQNILLLLQMSQLAYQLEQKSVATDIFKSANTLISTLPAEQQKAIKEQFAPLYHVFAR